ncbi:hypothetical protein MMC15_005356 [Xylographa vitiligo]|nr:hypothetical protein [Xylographa vitiligo]
MPAYSWDLKEYWMEYANDWSFHKGDPPLTISNAFKIESTTVHRVDEETSDSQETHMIVEANIAQKDLSPLVQGHEVDGIPLFTSSVYVDIALSLGTYLLKGYCPDQQKELVDVADMSMPKAKILRPAPLNRSFKPTVKSTGRRTQRLSSLCHSTVSRNYRSNRDALYALRIEAFCKHSKNMRQMQNMQALQDGIAKETTARPMVYRAIRPLARFHDKYRAIDEIMLDCESLEASSRLSFGSVTRGVDLHTHPAIIDSLTQSRGFTMNCNDCTDLDVQVFMNHGWGSFQIFEPMDFE